MSRTIRAFAGFVAGLGAVGLATLSNAQESPVPKPTPEHERLARDVGTWYATIKSWMQGPGSEPSVSKGVEVAKMMPGGPLGLERVPRQVRRHGVSRPRADRL